MKTGISIHIIKGPYTAEISTTCINTHMYRVGQKNRTIFESM